MTITNGIKQMDNYLHLADNNVDFIVEKDQDNKYSAIIYINDDTTDTNYIYGFDSEQSYDSYMEFKELFPDYEYKEHIISWAHKYIDEDYSFIQTSFDNIYR